MSNKVIDTPIGEVEITGKAEYYESGNLKSFITEDEICIELNINNNKLYDFSRVENDKSNVLVKAENQLYINNLVEDESYDTNISVVLNYTFDHVRKLYRSSISFYENGNIKSIYAENPVYIKT